MNYKSLSSYTPKPTRLKYSQQKLTRKSPGISTKQELRLKNLEVYLKLNREKHRYLPISPIRISTPHLSFLKDIQHPIPKIGTDLRQIKEKNLKFQEFLLPTLENTVQQQISHKKNEDQIQQKPRKSRNFTPTSVRYFDATPCKTISIKIRKQQFLDAYIPKSNFPKRPRGSSIKKYKFSPTRTLDHNSSDINLQLDIVSPVIKTPIPKSPKKFNKNLLTPPPKLKQQTESFSRELRTNKKKRLINPTYSCNIGVATDF